MARKSKKSKKRGSKTNVFEAGRRASRNSRLRRNERDRTAKRLALLLEPDSQRKSSSIKRRKRGPKKFRRTINALQNVSRNTRKADTFRRETSRLFKSAVATAAGLKAIGEFLGISSAEARVVSRL